MSLGWRVHLTLMLMLGFALMETFLQLTGNFGVGVLIGLVVWLPLQQLLSALLPTSWQRCIDGAQGTASVYRSWAARLVGRSALGRERTPSADAARLAAGARLWMLAVPQRDGVRLSGYLMLRPAPDGATALAWRPRGRSMPAQPIATGSVEVREDRRQENAILARMGLTSCVRLDGTDYWLRRHDLDVVLLALGPAARPAAATTTG